MVFNYMFYLYDIINTLVTQLYNNLFALIIISKINIVMLIKIPVLQIDQKVKSNYIKIISYGLFIESGK